MPARATTKALLRMPRRERVLVAAVGPRYSNGFLIDYAWVK